jgi:hypothetical protein
MNDRDDYGKDIAHVLPPRPVGKELEKENTSFSTNLPITIQTIPVPIWINFLQNAEIDKFQIPFCRKPYRCEVPE